MMADTPNQQTLRIAADWWLRLRDPAATARTTEQWLAWTAEDEDHLAAFERITELAMRLGAFDQVTRAQLVAEFAPPLVMSRRWLSVAAAAAVAVLAVLGGYLTWYGRDGRTTPQVYSSAVADRRDVTLDDGTHVTLGGATRLTTHFSHDERQVELAEGEAYFEVTHNAKRPFVVRVGNLTVRDVGTAFDVRRTGDRVTVNMAEGRVRIFDQADGKGDGLEAVAGQAVSYDPAHPAMRVSSSDPAQAAAWRDDRLEFDNEPLAVVVANINRYSTQPVRIADADIAPLTFTGTVRTDAIEDWLHALPQVLPLKVSNVGGQTVLSDARGTSPR
jgi:transmembrane sensor